MPLRALLDAGCNVALGVDGANSNDSQNPFEMMKMTALLHTQCAPNASRWPTSREILRMATRAGAQSELIQHEVGSLSEGMKADIILLNMDTIHWRPLNDPKKHLVFCEPGTSVDTSIVNGRLVMEGGRIQTVDIPDLTRQLGSLMPTFRANLDSAQKWTHRLWPVIEGIYYRIARTSTGLNRWIDDEDGWTEWDLSELMAGETNAVF
jgi:5-methylthioadenosine/S-adenosylhomocysteine deaminase